MLYRKYDEANGRRTKDLNDEMGIILIKRTAVLIAVRQITCTSVGSVHGFL